MVPFLTVLKAKEICCLRMILNSLNLNPLSIYELCGISIFFNKMSSVPQNFHLKA